MLKTNASSGRGDWGVHGKESCCLIMRSYEDLPIAYPASGETTAISNWPQLTQVDCVQVLEIRGGDGDRDVEVTVAIAADAIQAICTALSEQLNRYAQDETEHAEDVLALREHTALVERFQPLAAGDGHAVVTFRQAELRTCLLELTRYVERVDDEHYQAPDLRARLQIIKRIIPALWDANAATARPSQN
jgi:hypothetical protein